MSFVFGVALAYFTGADAATAELEALSGKMDRQALRGMEIWDIPGVAYAVVSGDRVVHQACFGVRRAGESGSEWQVDRDTVFQAGSTTKAFTATLMAMLVEEEALCWEDCVRDRLPRFRLRDPFAESDFRIADLMVQHSGLPDHSLDEMAILGYGRQEIIGALAFVEPETPFRSAFAYQNGLFLVAAAVIEKVTGRSWEENLRERIFLPLGMESAGSTFEGFTSRPERMAWLHRLDGDGNEVLPLDWPWQDWVYTMGPAGSVHLDIEDFARWLCVQVGRGSFAGTRFISQEATKHLIAPATLIHLGEGKAAAYCQGWLRESVEGLDLVWHNGSTLGAHSIIAFLPDEELGLVVLTNQNGNNLPEALMRTLVDLCSEKEGKDWILEYVAADEENGNEAAEPFNLPRPLEDYEGEYVSSVYGSMEIVSCESSLRLDFQSPKAQSLSLRPWDGDVFVADWRVFPDPRIFVRFEADGYGPITAVIVEPLDDDEGLGRFTKQGP